MAGCAARLPAEASPDLETVVWHPEATILLESPTDDVLAYPGWAAGLSPDNDQARPEDRALAFTCSHPYSAATA
jgi:hypothetical protein